LEKYPDLKREEIESTVAEVKEIISNENNNDIAVRIKNLDTEKDLLLNMEKENFDLVEGQKILVVTTKLWGLSSPPQNSPLELIILSK